MQLFHLGYLETQQSFPLTMCWQTAILADGSSPGSGNCRLSDLLAVLSDLQEAQFLAQRSAARSMSSLAGIPQNAIGS
jgi:hypothetical protein